MVQRMQAKYSRMSRGAKVTAVLFPLAIILFPLGKMGHAWYARYVVRAEEDHRMLVVIYDWIQNAPNGIKAQTNAR